MLKLYVYGAERICPSCVSFPSSKETAFGSPMLFNRKYGKQVVVHYVDIYHPIDPEQALFAREY